MKTCNFILTAKALGKIEPNANAAIPALTKALYDRVSYVRTAAKKALTKIRGQ